MSDQRLRELERRWRSTGAPEDHAALLVERVRASDLPEERLRLAAYLGHESAVMAVGEPEVERLRQERVGYWTTPREPDSTEDEDSKSVETLNADYEQSRRAREAALGSSVIAAEDAHADWVMGLTTFGHDFSVHAALTAATWTRNSWDPAHGEEDWRREAQRAFEATKAWLACPCEDHRQLAANAFPSRFVRWAGAGPEPRMFFGGPCSSAAETVRCTEDPEDYAFAAWDGIQTAAQVIAHDRGKDRQGDITAEHAELRVLLSETLAGWALR